MEGHQSVALADLGATLNVAMRRIQSAPMNSPNESELTLLDDIDKNLEIMKRYTTHLRNAGLPINRLPEELLTMIFRMQLNSTAFDSDSEWTIKATYHRKLISFASVCQHWRAVCLRTPLFWARLQIYPHVHPELVHLCLVRSLSTPLHIEAGYGSQRDDTIPDLQDVFSETTIARTAILHITLPPNLDTDTGFLRQAPAQLLEELRIRVDGGPPSTQPRPLFFAGKHPRLRRLGLSGSLYLISSLGQVDNLRELRLSSLKYRSAQQFGSLLAFLRTLHRLESLNFISVDTPDTPPSGANSEIVHLPYLKTLFCSVSFKDANTLTSYLDFPPHAETHFRVTRVENGGGITSRTVPLRLPNIGRATGLFIESAGRGSAGRSEFTTSGTGPSCAFTFALEHYDITDNRSLRAQTALAICDAFSLHQLEELRLLGNDASFASQYFRRSLAKLTALSRLTIDVRMSDAAAFLQDLIPDVLTGVLPCPRLSEMTLIGFDPKFDASEPLCEFVKGRKQIGSPLRALTVYTDDTIRPKKHATYWKKKTRSLKQSVGTLQYESFTRESLFLLPGISVLNRQYW